MIWKSFNDELPITQELLGAPQIGSADDLFESESGKSIISNMEQIIAA